MPDNEIEGVTVTAPSWNWGYVNWGYAGDVYNGSAPPHAGGDGNLEHVAAMFADRIVKVDPNLDLNDPNVQKAISTVKNIVADLWYAATKQAGQQGPDSEFVKIDGHPIGALAYKDALAKVEFNITAATVGATGAQTIPSSLTPGSATFRIDINPSQIASYQTAFTTPQEGLNYVVYHELGHATADALGFAVSQGYGSGGAVNSGLIEAYANTLGAHLAGSVYFDYPEPDELVPYNGMLPSTFISGSGGDDFLIDGAGADFLEGGAGSDTVAFSGHAAGVSATLVQPTAYSPSQDAFSSIESLSGSAFGDTLIGSGDANTLSGNAGADSLSGGAGDDLLSVVMATTTFTETWDTTLSWGMLAMTRSTAGRTAMSFEADKATTSCSEMSRRTRSSAISGMTPSPGEEALTSSMSTPRREVMW